MQDEDLIKTRRIEFARCTGSYTRTDVFKEIGGSTRILQARASTPTGPRRCCRNCPACARRSFRPSMLAASCPMRRGVQDALHLSRMGRHFKKGLWGKGSVKFAAAGYDYLSSSPVVHLIHSASATDEIRGLTRGRGITTSVVVDRLGWLTGVRSVQPILKTVRELLPS